jgi:hypothetical protein
LCPDHLAEYRQKAHHLDADMPAIFVYFMPIKSTGRDKMKFAKWVYAIAGIYGLLVTAPLYFAEKQIGEMMPPAVNHPEYYYGFIGVTLAWQLAFLAIARDPMRFRTLMLVTWVEKFGFFFTTALLYLQGRVAEPMLFSGTIDLILGILFVAAYFVTGRAHSAKLAAGE